MSFFDTSEINEVYSAIREGRISSEANWFILESGFLLPREEISSPSNRYNWFIHKGRYSLPIEISFSDYLMSTDL